MMYEHEIKLQSSIQSHMFYILYTIYYLELK